MNIYLNNNINPRNLVTFNNIPTIVKIDGTSGGTRAKLCMTLSQGGNITNANTITINNTIITSTNVSGNDVGGIFLNPQSVGQRICQGLCLQHCQSSEQYKACKQL